MSALPQLIISSLSDDKVLKKIIDEYEFPNLKPSQSYLEDLIKFIIYQQISTKAGNTIYKRFHKFYQGNESKIKNWTEEEWRSIGLSIQKKTYIENFFSSESLEVINSLSQEEEIDALKKSLTSLKGIGEWTADMFLIFSKNYEDIFPIKDLAIVNIIKKLYNVQTEQEILSLSKKWAPYRTYACLYLWESLNDNFPK